MKRLSSLESGEGLEGPSVVTVGNFDGFHVGHQRIVRCARDRASDLGASVVVVTFDPHPLSVLRPDDPPAMLTTTKQKLALLAESGVDAAVVLPTDRELLNIEAEDIIGRLVRRFHAVCFVEGASFGFGRNRAGDGRLLQSLGRRDGFDVRIIEPVHVAGDWGCAVSSSLVRRLVAEGRVADAALCLNRMYAISGGVVAGAHRGRELGFATANLAKIEQLVPGDGVYAGCASVGDATFPAAISVGNNPTFGGGERKVEAHLLGFEGTIPDRALEIRFGVRLRDQQAFDSPEALAKQIGRDVRAVREWSSKGTRMTDTRT